MTSRNYFRLAWLPVAFLLLFLSPREAEAKKMMLITYGETIKDRGELAPSLKTDIEANTQPGVKMGYCYSYAGLFFIDFWTWDGFPCFFKEREVWKLGDEEVKAYGVVAPEQVKKPFFYSFPEGLFIVALLGAGLVVLLVIGAASAAKDKKAASAVAGEDPRYARAVEILEGGGSQEDAIAALVEAGVTQAVAEEKVRVLAAAHAKDSSDDEDD